MRQISNWKKKRSCAAPRTAEPSTSPFTSCFRKANLFTFITFFTGLAGASWDFLPSCAREFQMLDLQVNLSFSIYNSQFKIWQVLRRLHRLHRRHHRSSKERGSVGMGCTSEQKTAVWQQRRYHDPRFHQESTEETTETKRFEKRSVRRLMGQTKTEKTACQFHVSFMSVLLKLT